MKHTPTRFVKRFALTFPFYFALIAAAMLMSACESTETLKPEFKNLTESVYASATLKPENEYKVYAGVAGIINKFYVQEGDTVREGEVLFEVDSRNTTLSLKNSALEYELARSNFKGKADKMEELRLNMINAQKNVQNDSLNYLRLSNLHRENIGSLSDLEKAKLGYELSKNNALSAQKKYVQAKEQLENELLRAGNRYQISQNTKEDHRVKSLITGKVYELYKKTGEPVSTQEPVLLLGDASDYFLEMEIDEADIVKIKEKQAVIVTLESYPERTFNASVTKIYPIMNEGTRTFTVKAKFGQMPPVLYPNLTAEANIIINVKQNVLTIPAEYLSEGRYVIISDKEKKEVVVGLRTPTMVEIVSGIDTSSRIIKPLLP